MIRGYKKKNIKDEKKKIQICRNLVQFLLQSSETVYKIIKVMRVKEPRTLIVGGLFPGVSDSNS